jgi:hypothetical protein
MKRKRKTFTTRSRLGVLPANVQWLDQHLPRETMQYRPGMSYWPWPWPFTTVVVSPLFNPDIHGCPIEYPHPSEYAR